MKSETSSAPSAIPPEVEVEEPAVESKSKCSLAIDWMLTGGWLLVSIVAAAVWFTRHHSGWQLPALISACVLILCLFLRPVFHRISRNSREAGKRDARKEIEKLLEHRTGHLSQFFTAIDHGPTAILILDRAGRIQFANRQFEAMSGKSREAVRGEIYHVLNVDSHSSEVYTKMWELLEKGERWEGERKDGGRIWRVGISPILDDDGQISKLIVAEEDVTERREMSRSIESQLGRMEQLYEIIADPAMSYADQIEKILHFGRTVYEADFGMVSQIQSGKLSVLHAVAREGVRPPRKGELRALEDSICGIAIGRDTPLAVHAVGESEFASHPSCQGEVRSYIGLPLTVQQGRYGTICFTSKKSRHTPFCEQDTRFIKILSCLVETALERMLEHNELETARRQAEAANRAKSEFLANMSHEIRSPLNIVLGFTQILQSDPSLNSGQLERLSAIHRHGEHLLSLISDVLEMSKIEAGRIDVEPALFNLQQLLEDVESMARAQARERGLGIRCHFEENLPGGIVSDQTRIRQVLINLLTNALKFTESGGIIFSVSVHPGNEPGLRTLRFEVEDTGVGIPEEKQEQIFKAFKQGSAVNDGGGAGLGLAITKKIAKLLGGTIELESIPGVGSTFCFEIAVEVAEYEMSRSCSLRKQLPTLKLDSPVRVLVVDDLESSRKVLTELLESVGFDVRNAASGEEAIALFEQFELDAIFMDWRMPGMGGAEATRRIKSTEKGKNTLVISISASALEENRLEAHACKSDAFIAKPFRVEDVLKILSERLGLEYDTPVAQEVVNEEHPPTRTGAELIDRVRCAAEDCDYPKLLDLSEEIGARDPDFASTVTRLARQFRYEDVISLLNLDSAA